MSYGSFWSGNLSLSSVMLMCSPCFHCLGEDQRWKMGLLTKLFSHWPIKNTGSIQMPQTDFRAPDYKPCCLSHAFTCTVCCLHFFSYRGPLLPLWLWLRWCSFVFPSSLTFNIWPLLRQKAFVKAGLSGEVGWHGGWRQYRVVSYPQHLYRVIF